MNETAKPELLLVEDDEAFREMLEAYFTRQGYRAVAAEDASRAVELAGQRDFDVAVFDMLLPGMSGLDLLKRFKADHADCEVMLLTGQGSIETAVEAMKLGAFDYLTKPFPLRDLQGCVDRAFERRSLKKENERLKVLLQRHQPSWEMVGRSAAMLEIFRLIERAGPSNKAILIQGESGTGKELVARALHNSSGRADQPLVAINCTALPSCCG